MNKQEAFEVAVSEALENYINPLDLPDIVKNITEMMLIAKNKLDKVSPNRTVLEFHEKFQVDISKPITTERINHRLNLMFEELSEFAEAGGTLVQKHYLELLEKQKLKVFNGLEGYYDRNEETIPDHKEMLDALLDIQYVLSGTTITFGMHKIFDEGFSIVHSNNMTKLHKGKIAILDTEKYLIGKGEFNPELFKYQAVDMKDDIIYYLVTYNDKVTKPQDHTKVNLDEILDKWEDYMFSLRNTPNL